MKKTFTSLLCAMLLCVLPQTCKAEPSNNYLLDDILPKAIGVATIGMALYMVYDALYVEHPEATAQDQEHHDEERDEDEDRDRDDRHEKKEKEQESAALAQNEPEEIAPQEAAAASQESDAGFTFETSYQQAAYEAFDQFS